MIKLFLCCALCTCTLMFSLELHREKQRQAEAVRDLADVVSRIISLLRFEATDVFQICQNAFNNAEIMDFTEFRLIDGGEFPIRWKKACQGLSTDSESKRLFEAVGGILGTCDLRSQTERLSQIHTDLTEHSKSLREKADGTKKLYTTIGALLGLGIAIVII